MIQHQDKGKIMGVKLKSNNLTTCSIWPAKYF